MVCAADWYELASVVSKLIVCFSDTLEKAEEPPNMPPMREKSLPNMPFPSGCRTESPLSSPCREDDFSTCTMPVSSSDAEMLFRAAFCGCSLRAGSSCLVACSASSGATRLSGRGKSWALRESRGLSYDVRAVKGLFGLRVLRLAISVFTASS